MSRQQNKNNSAQFKGLTYQAKVPAFLAAMQRKAAGGRSPSPDGPAIVSDRRRSASPPQRGADGRIREAMPERPREGKWAGGSDDEDGARRPNKGKGKVDDAAEEDEWEARWGGGQDGDGPQIVVLKEGKHLSEAEVAAAKRGDRPQKPSGETADSLEQYKTSLPVKQPSRPVNSFQSSAKQQADRAQALANKRKQPAEPVDPVKAAKQKKKETKKEKEKKGLLSFDDE